MLPFVGRLRPRWFRFHGVGGGLFLEVLGWPSNGGGTATPHRSPRLGEGVNGRRLVGWRRGSHFGAPLADSDGGQVPAEVVGQQTGYVIPRGAVGAGSVDDLGQVTVEHQVGQMPSGKFCHANHHNLSRRKCQHLLPSRSHSRVSERILSRFRGFDADTTVREIVAEMNGTVSGADVARIVSDSLAALTTSSSSTVTRNGLLAMRAALDNLIAGT